VAEVLVVPKSTQSFPPGTAIDFVEAMERSVRKYAASGKLE
jgi:hypothetical protein